MTGAATILAADDTQEETDILHDFLSALGYNVLVAHDGLETLTKVRLFHPDLLLLDIHMPGMDGFEVCRRLKADPLTADIPVLMVTGLRDLRDRVKGLGVGADDYIIKPFDFEELAARIAARLRAKQEADRLRLEQARTREVLQRYLAQPVVETILNGSDLALGGTRREVTVLFVDLHGFTALAERTPPEKVLELLNAHLGTAAEAVLVYRGTLDKFMGDAMLTIFNAPHPQPDHARRAVRAAWLIRTRLQQLHKALPPEHRLVCGIGIHTGEAVVGNIGAPWLMNYTAVGDTVNIAKRLEEIAGDGEIVLSRETYVQVEELVEVRPLGLRRVRHRKELVEAFVMLGWK